MKRDVHRQFHVVYIEYNDARGHLFSAGQLLSVRRILLIATTT